MLEMPFPSIFAIYRKDTDGFLFLQPDISGGGSIYRFQQWNRPVKHYWKDCTDKEKETMPQWFQGQQWYVVPLKEQPILLQTMVLNGKSIRYWSLGHVLVWADYSFGTKSLHPDNWKQWPSVPILEFQDRSLIPMYESGIHLNWLMTSRMNLLECSNKGWSILYALLDTTGSDKPLRIRTPLPRKEDDEDTTPVEESLIHYAPKPRNCCTQSSASVHCLRSCVMFTFLVGIVTLCNSFAIPIPEDS